MKYQIVLLDNRNYILSYEDSKNEEMALETIKFFLSRLQPNEQVIIKRWE